MNLIQFANVAACMARFSKDPSTQVGAVIVDDDGNILTTGYNGFPRGVQDHPWRYANRDIKLQYVAHAEANSIAQAARNGIRLKDSNLIVTALHPCADCAKLIIQAGIKRVFAPTMPTNSKWLKEAETAAVMFAEAGVTVEEYQP